MIINRVQLPNKTLHQVSALLLLLLIAKNHEWRPVTEFFAKKVTDLSRGHIFWGDCGHLATEEWNASMQEKPMSLHERLEHDSTAALGP